MDTVFPVGEIDLPAETRKPQFDRGLFRSRLDLDVGWLTLPLMAESLQMVARREVRNINPTV